jgi:hypothetical protein
VKVDRLVFLVYLQLFKAPQENPERMVYLDPLEIQVESVIQVHPVTLDRRERGLSI